MRERAPRCRSKRWGVALAACAALVGLASPAAGEESFDQRLARVDKALKSPRGASAQARDACLSRRNFAVRLYDMGETVRAERGIRFCLDVLGLPLTVEEKVVVDTGPSMEEVQAQAAREVEQALGLTPDLANGLKVYRSCAQCHTPEGWGLRSGMVPQLAGQHRNVIIKQLADIRAGHRDAWLMLPYSSVEAIGGAQAVADVAGYIDTLEISVDNGKGSGEDLELGERLYQENCVSCHGAQGEGNAESYAPRIQAQHYRYLVRQFEWIRDGKRRNSNAEMAAQIQGFDEREIHALMDYVSRLQPPEELRAPPGWRNPDFGTRAASYR